MKKGDIIFNRCQTETNPYSRQVVLDNNGYYVRTIDYMGNIHNFNKPAYFLEVIGHLKEYDDYTQALSRLPAVRKQTNADKIRAMSDEELAEFIPIAFNFCCNPSDKCLEAIFNRGECEKTTECTLKWLQSEVEGNDD